MDDFVGGLVRMVGLVTSLFVARYLWMQHEREQTEKQERLGKHPLRIELRHETLQGSHHPYVAYRVVIKGILPVRRKIELVLAASIFDVTDELDRKDAPMRPVISTLDRFQEPGSACYQDVRSLGEVEPGRVVDAWTPVLEFIPETLVPPVRGHRRFRVFVTAFDAKAPPRFQHGWFVGDVLYNSGVDFEWDVEDDGYEEKAALARRAEELIVELAVSMARADGSMGEAEAEVIRGWITACLDDLEEEKRPERYRVLSTLLAAGHEAAPENGEELERLSTELLACRIPDACRAGVALCLDVIVSDGSAARGELERVNTLAERLGIDPEMFRELKDKRLLGARHETTRDVDFHALLGIDPAWDRERIRLHLNGLYTTWNGRAEAFTDPERRAQAEHMLETIARARQALLA